MRNTSLLFVCVANSCRSQIAEAFANIYGAGKIQAFSAGSKPSGRVDPKAIESMREVGYDLSTHWSKSLEQVPDLEYDYAITMGCGDECPLVRARNREDWEIPDPKGMSADGFRSIRKMIETRIKELLARV